MGKKYSKVVIAGAIILVLAIVMTIMTVIGIKDSSAFVDIPETDTNTVHVYEIVLDAETKEPEIIEVIKEIEVPVYTEIIREIEVPVIQEVEVIKEVEVVKEVEVPVYTEIIREIEVPVVQEVEVIKEVEVVKIIEVPVYTEVVREIEVPVIQEVEVIKEVEVVKIIEVPVYIPCEHEDQITEEVVDVRTTKFSLSNGSYILVTWNEEAVVDNVIHDILYYLLPVEFSGNGEAMTLTITGENCVFYSDRVEYDGIIIGYLQGEIVNGVMNVTEMSTSGVTLD